jgi:tetratricopeptide (TPR) repeat protein
MILEEFLGTERFEIRNRLGGGGFGVVYRAFDRERQADVALKILSHVSADSVHRLKHEFRSLAGITHPNLVVLYEFCFGAGEWFYTMELVEGTDFLTYVSGGDEVTPAETRRLDLLETTPRDQPVRADKPMVSAPGHFDEGYLRSTLIQVARGVQMLHEKRTLHGDLKPANVLVTPKGRAVILDFGLATSLTPDELYETVETGFRCGTPAYMSPEQAAAQPTTEASDWYSVGVMLYQALTGSLPFWGTISEVLAQKRLGTPPLPSRLASGVPADLESLCMDLLAQSPQDRPTGVEVLRRLEGAKAGAGTVLTSAQNLALGFVGRQSELRVLCEAFDAVQSGRPVQVHVHGVSGIGKTALVRRFLAGLREDHDCVVLAGRCYECESVPYKMFDSLIDGLVRYLRRLTRAEAESLMPRDVRVLARLFPTLLRVDAVVAAPPRNLESGDPHELRRRAFAALKELFGRITDRRPLVLFIDDLQWGDKDSTRLLAYLLSPPDPPKLLLVASYRSEEVGSNPVLQAVLQSDGIQGIEAGRREIAVSALSESESLELAVELLGSRDGEALGRAQIIAQEAQGSPFFVRELVEYVKAGLSQHGVQLNEMLSHRISLLPEDARQLLAVIAVAGHPVAQGLAAKTADLEGEAERALSILRSVSLIRSGGRQLDDSVETYHDRIREAVVGHLVPADRQQIHQRLAAALETSTHPDPEKLMVHWEGAKKPEQAATYAAIAAVRAAEALAFDRAAELFRFSLDRLPDDDPRHRTLKTQLADALANAGRAPEAADAYLSAAEGASWSEEFELKRRAAEQLLISGHSERGRQVAASVLKAVGLKMPATPRRAFLSLLLHRARIRLRGVGFRERDQSQIPYDTLRRVDTCWSMGIGLSMVDTTIGAIFASRCLLLSLASGEPRRTARALAFEGGHRASIRGHSTRAIGLIQTAEALAQRIDDPHVQGFTTLMGGIASYFTGSFRRALEACDRAGAIFRDSCKGATWELATANAYATYSLYGLGEWAELSERVPLLLDAAQRRNNEYATTLLRVPFGMVAWLARGDIEGARKEADNAIRKCSPSTFQLQHAMHFFAVEQIDQYVGDGPAAWNRIQETWPALRRSLLLKIEVIRFLALQIRTNSALLARSGPSIPRIVLRDAGRIGRIGIIGAKPLAQLVQSAVLVRRGRTEAAVALLKQAATGFDGAEMKIHAAATRHRLGELVGGEEGRSLVDIASTAMCAQRIKSPARVTAMLVPGSAG